MPTGRPNLPRRTPSAIDAAIAVAACAVLVTLGGCGGRAHNDLYRQRMANEIRLLEDQLYDADYQNRVLRDKVIRLQQKSASAELSDDREREAPRILTPRMNDVPSDADDVGSADGGPGNQGMDDLDLDDLEAPFVDEGEIQDLPPPLEDPQSANPQDSGEKIPADQLLPAPGGPEPPGREDLQMPEILPGQPSPPPTGDQDDNLPLGRISLPESLQPKVTPAPQELRIHNGLSGGHRFDGESDLGGVFLVINAVDQGGKTVDLSQFDLDADLTVVVLDPQREPAEARIGRWEFDAQQLTDFVRPQPTSGLHIPLRWQGTRPQGEEVIVHVRLRGEDEEMKCEGKVKVAAVAVAQWTPRGDRR